MRRNYCWLRHPKPAVITSLLASLLATMALPTRAGNAPAIVQQPQSVVVAMGDTVRLACVVTGTPPLSLIWQQDGAFLGNQTNAALVISNAQPVHSGRYRLAASNNDGLALSDSAEVIVHTNRTCNYPWLWNLTGISVVPASQCYSFVAGLAVDADGNTFLTGPVCSDQPDRSDYDILTLKIDPSGKILWQARFDDPGHGADTPRDLAIDAMGNCYVVGQSYRQQAPNYYDNDYVTLKYTSDGHLAWATNYRRGHAEAWAVRVDTAGYVYVTGWAGTVKYNPLGRQVWNDSLPAFFLELAGDGMSVYVAAGIPQTGLALLNDSGEQVWRWPVEEGITALAVDGHGAPCLLLQRRYSGEPNSQDIETVKLNAQGQVVWTNLFDGPYHLRDEAVGFSLDAAGNIHVAGLTSKPDGSTDAVVIKYDSTGQQIWSRLFNDTYNYSETPRAIAVDKDGGIYVAGGTEFSLTPNTYVTRQEALLFKLDRDGNPLWTSRYRSEPGNLDGFERLSLSGDGRIVAAGRATLQTVWGGRDVFLAAGYDQWTPRLWIGGMPAPGLRQGCLTSPRWSQFEILAATNLLNPTWRSIGTVTNFNGLVPFYDREAGQYPMRFYRAKEQAP